MNEEELRDRWFNQVTDHYLTTGTMSAEDYARLTPTQKTVVQWLKRAFNRITANYDK